MKKKTRATASRAGKRPKSAASGRKAAPRRSSAPGSRPPAVSNGTKATIRRLKAQLARTQAQIEELQASADTDFLLGIPNRRGFERELNRAIAYIKRYRAGGALVVLDVDRLKPINDAFGHAAGDQVLKAIVTTLLAQVRASDVVGRLGGDEFALLLWNLSETDAQGQGGRAGGSDRSPHLRVRWPHHYRGRLRGRHPSRYPLRSRPRAGSGRQRHVCAQGAAAARGEFVDL